jgi:fructosamine-3-kinase
VRNFHENFELDPEHASEMLRAAFGPGAALRGLERLSGGACSAVYAMDFDGPPHQAVVKIYPNPDGDFARERQLTQYVAQLAAGGVPRVYHEDSTRARVPFAFILLERLGGVNLAQAELGPGDRARIDVELAEALLELHSHRREFFGEVLEPGSASPWSSFILPRLHELRADMQGPLRPELLDRLDAALGLAPEALADQGPPTLVHGDVWATNIIVRQAAGRWRLSGLVDWVATRFADVEIELAYLECWRTVTPAFFTRYCRRNPLRDGYQFRRLFYWLWTYMLHVHLFGDAHYSRLVEMTVRGILDS